MSNTQNLERLELSRLLEQAKPTCGPTVSRPAETMGSRKARSLKRSRRFSESILSTAAKFTVRSPGIFTEP